MLDTKEYCEGSMMFADQLKFVGSKQVECPKCKKGVSIKFNGKLRNHTASKLEEITETEIQLSEFEDDDEYKEPSFEFFDFNKAMKRAPSEQAIHSNIYPIVYGEPVKRELNLENRQSVRIIRGQKVLIGKIGVAFNHNKSWGHIDVKLEDGKSVSINDWDVEVVKNEVNKEL